MWLLLQSFRVCRCKKPDVLFSTLEDISVEVSFFLSCWPNRVIFIKERDKKTAK